MIAGSGVGVKVGDDVDQLPLPIFELVSKADGRTSCSLGEGFGDVHRLFAWDELIHAGADHVLGREAEDVFDRGGRIEVHPVEAEFGPELEIA